MRKLIMWNLISLDGMFEGAKRWDLEWHQSIWGPELERLSIEQLRSADLLLFGRHTYQGMATYWQEAQDEVEVASLMNGLPKVVFSRTLKSLDWSNARLMQKGPVEEVLRLKQEGDGPMYIFGSADVSSIWMKHDLIDEYRLAVAPVVLGRGRPLFKPGQKPLNLRLTESLTLQSGGIILHYQPIRNG
jgi:dihydrofolate reductase